jgi:hypothetical protein
MHLGSRFLSASMSRPLSLCLKSKTTSAIAPRPARRMHDITPSCRFYSSLDHVQNVLAQRLQHASAAKASVATYNATQKWASSQNKLLARIAAKSIMNRDQRSAAGPIADSGGDEAQSRRTAPSNHPAHASPATRAIPLSVKRQNYSPECVKRENHSPGAITSASDSSSQAATSAAHAATCPPRAAPAVAIRDENELRSFSSSSRAPTVRKLFLHVTL